MARRETFVSISCTSEQCVSLDDYISYLGDVYSRARRSVVYTQHRQLVWSHCFFFFLFCPASDVNPQSVHVITKTVVVSIHMYVRGWNTASLVRLLLWMRRIVPRVMSIHKASVDLRVTVCMNSRQIDMWRDTHASYSANCKDDQTTSPNKLPSAASCIGIV